MYRTLYSLVCMYVYVTVFMCMCVGACMCVCVYQCTLSISPTWNLYFCHFNLLSFYSIISSNTLVDLNLGLKIFISNVLECTVIDNESPDKFARPGCQILTLNGELQVKKEKLFVKVH